MKKLNVNIVFNKESKVQALRTIKVFEKFYKIERVRQQWKLRCETKPLFESLQLQYNFDILTKINENDFLILINNI